LEGTLTKPLIGLLLTSAALGAIATSAMAQPAAPTASAADSQASNPLTEIVVTAMPGNPMTKIKSSVSVSTLSAADIAQSAPSSAADIVRDIPGFRSEASGGEGNANVSVRGLPLASGGAKYVQFQEDGLPILQYGDIDFATGDQFLRADFNTDRVEAIRGGSSSTAVSDAPGGVINFIDKDGKVAGGALGITTGLDYDETRYDFDYGQPISDDTRFHVGGFYHSGEGPRSTGYDAVSGGQVKFNVTHTIEGGFIKFDFKFLDDRSPVFLPVPVELNGASATNYPGFSANSGVTQSPYLLSDTAINANGQRVTTSISDGYHSKETAFGGEFSKAIGDGWKLDDKFRVSSISGDFVGPYTQNVGTASSLATTLGYTGGSFAYANGPNAGQAFNGYAQELALFNVTLNDVGNYMNDLKLSKTFEGVYGGSSSVQAGFFASRQNIVEDWHWNTYLEQVASKDSALLNLTSATGKMITANGLFAYGEPAFGNCCIRYYDVHYSTSAPYVSGNWQNDHWNIDASLRYDIATASGTYGGSTGTSAINVDNTPTLTTPDMTVPVVNTYYPVQYTKGYLSYSFGANYEVDPNLAFFARTSEGGRFNAERLLFGGGVAQSGPSIGKTSQDDAVNEVYQTEGGVKYRSHGVTLFLTGFYAITTETNADFTNLTEEFLNDTYHAYGFEADVTYRWREFSFRGGATYTDATIVKSQDNPATVGNTPQRQAPWVYQFTPSYSHGPFTVGVNVIGTTNSFTSNANTQIQPGYVEVNMFANYDITPHLRATITGNNVFNTIGITEVDGTNVARSINGETFTGSLKYSF
jgi:outer membrane receptor protein involved in Fe transport